MSNNCPLSVKELNALREGDKAAFEKLFYSHQEKLFAFIFKLLPNREEAEELVQEVFVKFWEKKHFLDPTQNLDNYLFSIARNLVFDKARRRAYEFAYIRYLKENTASFAELTANQVQFNELQQLIDVIYDSLPPVRKQVFTLSRFEGRSNSEIAELLQTSTSNIENHLNKALRVFRKKFKQYHIEWYCLLIYLGA
ncbi:RNA polymerase sigma-70 factor [Adhaeribacter aerolatus]|uniref:RNA polymerase sigma-70 factor n=1 Tax=Adhaeribacter aerolatus TaxID=670289 RepID=A0A512AUT3_9BACT|nr:RNA polymerase sigma-70 factor [Adhaeribacter aerolatus]GEO03471.1 RNA polymerase sigma-70 factor [Adhaeribacter aerolatus]